MWGQAGYGSPPNYPGYGFPGSGTPGAGSSAGPGSWVPGPPSNGPGPQTPLASAQGPPTPGPPPFYYPPNGQQPNGYYGPAGRADLPSGRWPEGAFPAGGTSSYAAPLPPPQHSPNPAQQLPVGAMAGHGLAHGQQPYPQGGQQTYQPGAQQTAYYQPPQPPPPRQFNDPYVGQQPSYPQQQHQQQQQFNYAQQPPVHQGPYYTQQPPAQVQPEAFKPQPAPAQVKQERPAAAPPPPAPAARSKPKPPSPKPKIETPKPVAISYVDMEDDEDDFGEPGSPSNNGLPRGRVRISKACDACNQRRRKCSGSRPTCDRCEARNMVCVYTDTGKKRGPAPTRPKDPVKEARKRKREEEVAAAAAAAAVSAATKKLRRTTTETSTSSSNVNSPVVPFRATPAAPSPPQHPQHQFAQYQRSMPSPGSASSLPATPAGYPSQRYFADSPPAASYAQPPANPSPLDWPYPYYPGNYQQQQQRPVVPPYQPQQQAQQQQQQQAFGLPPRQVPLPQHNASSYYPPLNQAAPPAADRYSVVLPTPMPKSGPVPAAPIIPARPANASSVPPTISNNSEPSQITTSPIPTTFAALARSPNMAIASLLSDFGDSDRPPRSVSPDNAHYEQKSEVLLAPGSEMVLSSPGLQLPLAVDAAANLVAVAAAQFAHLNGVDHLTDGPLPRTPSAKTFLSALAQPSPSTSILPFGDLPDICSDVCPPLNILGYFLSHMNPILGMLLHPPTMSPPTPLLLCSLLAYTVPHMPIATTKSRHAISLAYFQRAQRLLQPIMVPLLSSRKPTWDELAAIFMMALHAGTASQSAMLGYRLGFFAGSLMKGWNLVGKTVKEQRMEELELARKAPGETLQRESWRRLIWSLALLDRMSAAAIVDAAMEVPVLPDATLRGLLLPCPSSSYSTQADAGEIVAAGTGNGATVMAESVSGGGDEFWKARLFVVLGWVVDFHKVSFLHRVLAEFLAARPTPDETPESIWLRILYHVNHVVLHTPRKGAIMDPSALLSQSNWLASPSFGIAAGHAGAAAELLARLDVLDPLREYLDPSHMVFAQMAGVVCYVRAVVAGRADEGEEKQRAAWELGVARRQQATVGQKWRMAAQMAVFLAKLEEGLDKVVVPSAEPGDEVPVIWTQGGLLMTTSPSSTSDERKHVMLGWDQAVDFGQGPRDDGSIELLTGALSTKMAGPEGKVGEGVTGSDSETTA